jgi:predicted outer membrane repeat protein
MAHRNVGQGEFVYENIVRYDGKEFGGYEIPNEIFSLVLGKNGHKMSIVDYDFLGMNHGRISDSYCISLVERESEKCLPPWARTEIRMERLPDFGPMNSYPAVDVIEKQDFDRYPEYGWMTRVKRVGVAVRVQVDEDRLWIDSLEDDSIWGYMKRKSNITFPTDCFYGDYTISDGERNESMSIGGRLEIWDACYPSIFAGRLMIVRAFCDAEWLEATEYSFIDGKKKTILDFEASMPPPNGLVFVNNLSRGFGGALRCEKASQLMLKSIVTVDLLVTVKKAGEFTVEYADLGHKDIVSHKEQAFMLKTNFGKEFEIRDRVYNDHILRPVRFVRKRPYTRQRTEWILECSATIEQVKEALRWSVKSVRHDYVKLNIGDKTFLDLIRCPELELALVHSYPHKLMLPACSRVQYYLIALYRHAMSRRRTGRRPPSLWSDVRRRSYSTLISRRHISTDHMSE